MHYILIKGVLTTTSIIEKYCQFIFRSDDPLLRSKIAEKEANPHLHITERSLSKNYPI